MHHYLGLNLCVEIAQSLSSSDINLLSIFSLCPPFLRGISVVIIHHMFLAKTFSHSSGLISHIAVILMVVCLIGEQELAEEGY